MERCAPLSLRLSLGECGRCFNSKIREGVGGRMRAFIFRRGPLFAVNLPNSSGPLRPVYQGYGLTEDFSGRKRKIILALTNGDGGTANCKCERAHRRGWRNLRSRPVVMKGYYKEPEETRGP